MLQGALYQEPTGVQPALALPPMFAEFRVQNAGKSKKSQPSMPASVGALGTPVCTVPSRREERR